MIATYLRSLSRRERTLVVTGIVVVFATVAYVAVLEPGYRRLHMLRSQVPVMQSDLQWMKHQVRQQQQLLSSRANAGSAATPPLLTIVEESASRAGLRDRIERMQPGDRGSVRVWFDDVPFDPWLGWLGGLRQYEVTVAAANIDRTGAGRVDIRVTLQSRLPTGAR